jgi:rhodanese-related sulfurtransferase
MRLSLNVPEVSELTKAGAISLIDVRKEAARGQSGLCIPNSSRELPFDVENWWRAYASRQVVVYCVHGHEVSQGVCAVLRSKGIDAAWLEGGFEAWRDAGLTLETLSEGDE